MEHLISLKEQSKEDLINILELAKKIKTERKRGRLTDYLSNKTLIMLFQKTSTRTRLSFEAAMTELGGHAIFLDARASQFSLTDFGDEIRAVMRYGDILMFRALKAVDVQKAASYNQIPVIDACSEKYHPCQAMGDILTMIEYSGGLNKIGKIAWLGIQNNVSNTLKLACAKLGIRMTIISPEQDSSSIDSQLDKQAEQTGNVKKTTNLKVGLDGVSYIHTDTWMNMEFFSAQGGPASGKESKVKPEFKKEYERRVKVFTPYQLSAKIVDKFSPKAKIMHCMPCHIGYEITRDAVDHKNSIIFDQAENRLHIQKAIILWLLGHK